MDAGSSDNQISTVLVDESFATEDDQFVDRVRMESAPKYLAALADRWKQDPRSSARQQIFKYLALPLDRAGHHPVVKRLFKQAEASRDDELMAAFLVAFDRFVRHQRRARYATTFRPARRGGKKNCSPRAIRSWRLRRAMKPSILVRGNGSTFRVCFEYRSTAGCSRTELAATSDGGQRYFRRMGFQQPSEYPQAVSVALALYRDDDVARGENILDNWSLMHIAFRRSPVLQFKRTRMEVADGRLLGELAAAPQFEDLWKKPESATILLELVTQADSRLVRVWAIQSQKRCQEPKTVFFDQCARSRFPTPYLPHPATWQRQRVTVPALLHCGDERPFQGEAMASTTQPTTELPSAQEWKEVLEQILPPQGEWSEEEYLVLTDHRNRLVEFTDGFLEVLPMPTDKHQSVLQFLFLAFFRVVQPRGGKVHFAPLRLRIRPGKFREPDLLLLLSAADSRRQNRFWLGADLALEVVSEEKPERDLVDKRGDYADAHVPEYWIVNPQTETVTVLRLRGEAMKKLASTGVGNRRHQCCCRIFQSLSRRFSTRTESRVGGKSISERPEKASGNENGFLQPTDRCAKSLTPPRVLADLHRVRRP